MCDERTLFAEKRALQRGSAVALRRRVTVTGACCTAQRRHLSRAHDHWTSQAAALGRTLKEPRSAARNRHTRRELVARIEKFHSTPLRTPRFGLRDARVPRRHASRHRDMKTTASPRALKHTRTR